MNDFEKAFLLIVYNVLQCENTDKILLYVNALSSIYLILFGNINISVDMHRHALSRIYSILLYSLL